MTKNPPCSLCSTSAPPRRCYTTNAIGLVKLFHSALSNISEKWTILIYG
jgi:hypothetical protein